MSISLTPVCSSPSTMNISCITPTTYRYRRRCFSIRKHTSPIPCSEERGKCRTVIWGSTHTYIHTYACLCHGTVDTTIVKHFEKHLSACRDASVGKRAHAACISTAIHTYMTTLREQPAELETGVLKLLRRVLARRPVNNDSHFLRMTISSCGNENSRHSLSSCRLSCHLPCALLETSCVLLLQYGTQGPCEARLF